MKGRRGEQPVAGDTNNMAKKNANQPDNAAEPKAPKVKAAPVFDTSEVDGNHTVEHVASGTTVATYRPENGLQAAQAAEFLNNFSKKNAKNQYKEIDTTAPAEGESPSKLHVMLTKAVEAMGTVRPEKPAGTRTPGEFKQKEKTRASYTSGARESFQPDNVTEKDKAILGAIEELLAENTVPDADTIAAKLGYSSRNVVNGALSVLLAKGIVKTERVRVPNSDGTSAIKRVPEIIMDWRNLTPRPPKEKKAPLTKEEKAARAEAKKAELLKAAEAMEEVA